MRKTLLLCEWLTQMKRIFQAHLCDEAGPVWRILEFEDKHSICDFRKPVAIVCDTPRMNIWKRSFYLRVTQLLENGIDCKGYTVRTTSESLFQPRRQLCYKLYL